LFEEYNSSKKQLFINHLKKKNDDERGKLQDNDVCTGVRFTGDAQERTL
jgi:hypothetical protein